MMQRKDRSMKKTSKLECGGKRLDTDNLEAASEWLLDNIAGLRTFELQIVIHSEDLGCSIIPEEHDDFWNDYDFWDGEA